VPQGSEPASADNAVPAAPDLIGFGALNIDYIGSASRLSQARAEKVREWAARFDWNVETLVNESTIHRVIAQLGPTSLTASPGGSAWNVIFALAQMKIDVRLGYVGVVGREETPGLSFLRLMDSHSIDHRFVRENPGTPCGMCLSYIDDGERVMLTYPGANLDMAGLIRDNFDDLASYLATARYVHVTSFLDPETPVQVQRVLRAARQANPGLRICLDPGYVWSAHSDPPVRTLLSLADFLLLTHREFKALGSHAHGEPDQVVADRVLAECHPAATVVVAKRYNAIDVFRPGPAGATRQRFSTTAAASDEEIEDTTGAGDVFAAGLLAALASRRLQVELGTYLGLSLAREWARPRPAGGPPAYPDLSKGFWRPTRQRQRWAAQRGVFIAHGADPQWRQVQGFLEQDCGLPVLGLSGQAQGADLANQIRDHLAECGFGVCVLTAETGADEPGYDPGEPGYADQSVVHQAGLLQGRYGFRRVAILVEQGCRAFSNVAGLIRLDFPRGHIESTFWELERMLRREGLIR
jgi:sugar/nucleoside kinase (ribokinase family)